MGKQCMCEQPGMPCPLHGEVAYDNVPLCTYGVVDDLDASESWVCSLSSGHDGDHYLIRAGAAGRVTPVAPDAERDRRRAAYAAAQRDIARRALDRFLELVLSGGPTDDDFVVLVGVLSVYMEWLSRDAASSLHHKGNYGVTPYTPCLNERAHEPHAFWFPGDPDTGQRLSCPGAAAGPDDGYACEGERRGICSGGPAHHPACESAK